MKRFMSFWWCRLDLLMHLPHFEGCWILFSIPSSKKLCEILIYNKPWEEILQNVDMDLKLLKEKNPYVKDFKCSFSVQEVEYLGHIIFREGIKLYHNKNETMVKWSIPKIFKNLREFLVLIGYYHKFVKKYYWVLEQALTMWLKKMHFLGLKRQSKLLKNLSRPCIGFWY